MFLSLIVIIVMFICLYIYFYNRLVNAKTKVNEGWSGIIVQLKRRHSLVGNLVNTVKSAIDHENDILDKILTARIQALEALAQNEPRGIHSAEAELISALNSFVGYTEDNPEINANENVKLLQTQLEETEDQISAARRLYNGNVQVYNARILSIPSNFVAQFHNYKAADMFNVANLELEKIAQDPVVEL